MLSLSEEQPDEIVKVDLKYIEEYGVERDTTCLEFWAGFVGLEQNKKDYALTPKIGWMIRKKNMNPPKLKIGGDFSGADRVSVIVKEFPNQLLELKEIDILKIQFIDRIAIPDQFSKVKINWLTLTGGISEQEVERIKKMFPETVIRINEEEVGRPSKYGDDLLIYPW